MKVLHVIAYGMCMLVFTQGNYATNVIKAEARNTGTITRIQYIWFKEVLMFVLIITHFLHGTSKHGPKWAPFIIGPYLIPGYAQVLISFAKIRKCNFL